MNLILHCRVALICIRRNPTPNLDNEPSINSHSHTAVGLRSFPFVVSLSFPYCGRTALILHCRVAIILIQRSGYAHFHLPYRSHCHTAVGLRSFPFAVSLSFSYSGRATLILPCRYHSHTAVGLRSFCIVAIILIHNGRATLIFICRIALISIECVAFT